jgi:DNA repair protein RecN (Recombination protein N)
MLTELQVKDFAIITSSTLHLSQGMTTLTGETGAGKSILLGALGLVLGDRASPTTVRDGADRADITAVFDVTQCTDAIAWLQDHAMDQDNECILRRVVTRDGKSRAFINGTPVTIKNLRELSRQLINIHGQHDHQLMTLPDTQLAILDDFGECDVLLSSVREHWQAWTQKKRELDSIQSRLQARNDRLDTLRYQLQEFGNLKLDGIDFVAVDQEHKRLSNTTLLGELCSQAMDLLQDGNHALLSQLQQVASVIEQLNANDNSTRDVTELLSSAQIQLEEAVDTLRHYQHTIEPQPERLQELDTLLAGAYQLGKKHQCDLSDLAPLETRLRDEFDDLQSIDDSIESLETALAKLAQSHEKAAAKLTDKRHKASAQLSAHLTQAMQTLGMKGGTFDIEVSPRKLEHPTATGNDLVVFKVSANPGAAPRSMSDVASGGELSRLSLAVQLITSARHRVPTLIFDEVDTGVGGGVAETVGQQLRQLGDRCQVLCVTHLPQVAAQGHTHIKVSKKSSDNKTLAESKVLTDDESLEEIARMLGGVKITQRTRDHAREMLAGARDTGKQQHSVSKAKKKPAKSKKKKPADATQTAKGPVSKKAGKSRAKKKAGDATA